MPAHLLTPFNGPVPPSNLLDKLARGVAHAKGPAEWPHSLRATRAKIVELARVRAKESVYVEIVEEDFDDAPRDILRPSDRTNRKRPLYRQSSMDFILEGDGNIQENQSINRYAFLIFCSDQCSPSALSLSQRLQHTDRILSTSSYHPYSPTNSPVKRRAAYSPVLNPSTPSSTTLNSTASALRRSFSSISSSSSEAYSAYPSNPRVQRMKRSDSMAVPAGHENTLKYAPSFSAASVLSADSNVLNMDVDSEKQKEAHSSDEEERLRSRKAKKARRRSPPISPSPLPSAKVSTKKLASKTPIQAKSPVAPPTPVSSKRVARPRVNIERNPSILGGPLPLPPAPASSASQRMSIGSEESPRPSSSTHKTLRRVKNTTLSVRPMARRISFGTLGSPQEENREPHGVGAGLGLGSAFQLR